MAILKIGVTGSAGSGKSLVCECFARLGLVVLDCDRIAREVVAPGQAAYHKVVALFGSDVLLSDQTLDRAAIRRAIVADPDVRRALEALLHPEIIKEMRRQVADAVYPQEPACAVEVPLLFELGMASYFDVTLVVTADERMLEERICLRDQVDRESAKKILALQLPQEEKIRRADFVVSNTGDRETLFHTLDMLYRKLQKERLTKK